MSASEQAEQRWLVSREVLQHGTASRADGIAAAVEENVRRLGALLLLEAGWLLRVPRALVMSAQLQWQRFVLVRSVRTLDVRAAVAGLLLLAAKIEEEPVAVRRVLLSVALVWQRAAERAAAGDDDDNGGAMSVPRLPAIGSAEYHELREAALTAESHVLFSLGFNVRAEPSAGAVALSAAHVLGLAASTALLQSAWTAAADLYACAAPVLWPVEVLACAALADATAAHHVTLPERWHAPFGADAADVAAALAMLHRERTLPPPTLTPELTAAALHRPPSP